jgi:hypothetical protein
MTIISIQAGAQKPRQLNLTTNHSPADEEGTYPMTKVQL